MRIIRVIQLIALSMTLAAAVLPLSAYAQSVNVRTGQHAEYSRLVFDWTSRVEYTVKRDQKDKLIITFNKPAELNTAAAVSNPVPNITNAGYSGHRPA